MKGDKDCTLCHGTGVVTDTRYTYAGRDCTNGAITVSIPEAEYHSLLASRDALAARVRELEAGQGWVSVSERLPTHTGQVLVWLANRDEFRVARFAGAWFYMGREPSSDVIHYWKELSAPPPPTDAGAGAEEQTDG